MVSWFHVFECIRSQPTHPTPIFSQQQLHQPTSAVQQNFKNFKTKTKAKSRPPTNMFSHNLDVNKVIESFLNVHDIAKTMATNKKYNKTSMWLVLAMYYKTRSIHNRTGIMHMGRLLGPDEQQSAKEHLLHGLEYSEAVLKSECMLCNIEFKDVQDFDFDNDNLDFSARVSAAARKLRRKIMAHDPVIISHHGFAAHETCIWRKEIQITEYEEIQERIDEDMIPHLDSLRKRYGPYYGTKRKAYAIKKDIPGLPGVISLSAYVQSLEGKVEMKKASSICACERDKKEKANTIFQLIMDRRKRQRVMVDKEIEFLTGKTKEEWVKDTFRQSSDEENSQDKVDVGFKCFYRFFSSGSAALDAVNYFRHKDFNNKDGMHQIFGYISERDRFYNFEYFLHNKNEYRSGGNLYKEIENKFESFRAKS